MSEVEAGSASMLGFMASWFTPTVLFCVLNLVIGIIFITSNFKSQTKQLLHGEDNSHQLVRAPSLLERVRSINWSPYRSDQPHPFPPEAHYDGPVHHQTQLVRVPSLLERFMSINFSPYRSEQHDPFPPETHHPDLLHHQTEEVQTQLVRAPSLLERVMSINFSRQRSEQADPFPQEAHHTDPLHYQTQKATQGLDHDRDHDQDHHVTRSKSDTHGEASERVPEKMKKSASEKMGVDTTEDDIDLRRPATVRERKRSETASFGEDERVDERADDFINRFKQQLKLQRLDSLKRFKEMLNRGSAK